MGLRWHLIALACLACTSTVHGFWWRSGCCCPSYAYPVYVNYSYGVPGYMPRAGGAVVRPDPREPALATPKVAPPSSSEPPLATSPKSRAPVIIESRSQGGNYVTHKATGGNENCLVGFWNLSGRAVTLKVNGATHVVAADRAVNLELARSFVWQVDRGEPTPEQVPGEQTRFEVLIR